MRNVEIFKWYMPPPAHKGPRAKPYLTAYHMDADTAKERGAIRPEPSSRMVIQKAETPEEDEQLRRAIDTSNQGGELPH